MLELLPIKPENCIGANDFLVMRTDLILVLRFNLTLGVGAAGGLAILAETGASSPLSSGITLNQSGSLEDGNQFSGFPPQAYHGDF